MKTLLNYINDKTLKGITDKISAGIRLTPEEGLFLYESTDLPVLALLASVVRKRKNNSNVYFNRNFHIEPTNKCVYNCRFCSYHKPANDPESWEYSIDQMLDIVKRFDNKPVTEVHIVGGVHPSHDLHYYGELLMKIKKHRPSLHIKAFSAIELDYMIRKSGYTIEDGLKKLREYGLDSIPGGGAEIFDEDLRKGFRGVPSSDRPYGTLTTATGQDWWIQRIHSS
jgi:aminodeoxyfutalosine synthase